MLSGLHNRNYSTCSKMNHYYLVHGFELLPIDGLLITTKSVMKLGTTRNHHEEEEDGGMI